MKKELTYDIVFHDNDNNNEKGFKSTLEYCRDYIKTNAGSNHSYFEDYKGGSVCIVCNETGETIEVYSVDSGNLIETAI